MTVAAASRLAPAHTATSAAAGDRSLRAALTSGVAWGVVVSIALTIWIFYVLGGQDYYLTPLTVRGYEPTHRLLRPSGPAGQMFGVAGTMLMLVPFIYMARKRLGRMKSTGTLKTWLQIHLFCGIVGSVLITFHTSFKFNGIISAAYWSMVLVMLSGFVGRYFVRSYPAVDQGARTHPRGARRAGRSAESDPRAFARVGTSPAKDRGVRTRSDTGCGPRLHVRSGVW